MIIEKVCPHFIYQDDRNGEMVISCCTAMKEPHQVHEGNDEMYPCPLGFEAKRCYKVLSLGSDKVHQPTNADRIRGMSDEELARQNVRKRRGYCVWTTSDGREFTSYLGFGGGYRADEDTIALAVQHELEWLRQPAKEEHNETDRR